MEQQKVTEVEVPKWEELASAREEFGADDEAADEQAAKDGIDYNPVENWLSAALLYGASHLADDVRPYFAETEILVGKAASVTFSAIAVLAPCLALIWLLNKWEWYRKINRNRVLGTVAIAAYISFLAFKVAMFVSFFYFG